MPQSSFHSQRKVCTSSLYSPNCMWYISHIFLCSAQTIHMAKIEWDRHGENPREISVLETNLPVANASPIFFSGNFSSFKYWLIFNLFIHLIICPIIWYFKENMKNFFVTHMHTKSLNSCPDSFRPHGLTVAHQASCSWDFPTRILEWIVISFSGWSSRPRDQTHVC